MWKSVPLPADEAAMREALASVHPAVALFAVRSGQAPVTADTLAEWTNAPGLLGENAAVALGLLGDARAIPKLREILAGDCIVHTYRHPARAAYGWLQETPLCNQQKAALLLGRFADPASLPRLQELAVTGDDRVKDWAKVAAAKIS